MKILITGGAGYVGSVLTQLLLQKGHQVKVLDNLMYGGRSLLSVWSPSGFEFVRGDIRDLPLVRTVLGNLDAVVHLAAIVGDPACTRQPDLAKEVNQDASLALLAACKSAGIPRFVFASTCSNYGKMKDPNRLVDETSELSPVSLYAETKVAVERSVLNPALTGETCATPLRFATVFGVSPRMRFDLTVNEFTMEMLTKKRLVVFGEQFWRPYIHVRDMARGILTVLEAPVEKIKNQVFNIGSTNQNYQKQQLVEMIQPFCPEAEVSYVHKDEDPRDYRVSFKKANESLGFTTTHSVEDGIKEVAQLVTGGIIQDFYDPYFHN